MVQTKKNGNTEDSDADETEFLYDLPAFGGTGQFNKLLNITRWLPRCIKKQWSRHRVRMVFDRFHAWDHTVDRYGFH